MRQEKKSVSPGTCSKLAGRAAPPSVSEMMVRTIERGAAAVRTTAAARNKIGRMMPHLYSTGTPTGRGLYACAPQTGAESDIVKEMHKKRLGNSDMELSPIGVGAWAMGGGGWAFAWGPQEDDQSVAAIHSALDHGVNWIDTAAVYGLGHSEEVVARALATRAGHGPMRPYVFSKC